MIRGWSTFVAAVDAAPLLPAELTHGSSSSGKLPVVVEEFSMKFDAAFSNLTRFKI
jgi:hypothetical protein